MTECNPHPDAPHGFDRNGSHNEDRYVCDCEWWVQPVQPAVDLSDAYLIDSQLVASRGVAELEGLRITQFVVEQLEALGYTITKGIQ